MEFEDIIDFEKEAYNQGYNDGLNSKTQLKQIHMDAANTGTVRGINEGYKIGYHLGEAMIDSINSLFVENVSQHLTRKNKIQTEFIECAAKLGEMTLNDESYSACLNKNFELVRRIKASGKKKDHVTGNNLKETLDF